MVNTTFIDETGNSYGMLTVLGRSVKTKGRKVHWVCECDCGNFSIPAGTMLRNDNTTSCGCKNSNRLPAGEAHMNAIYGHYKRNAKKTGRGWELDKKTFRKLTSKNCYYCGAEPSEQYINEVRKRQFNGAYLSNGLDRIDNEVGYSADNVVPCCYRCNKAKGEISQNDFFRLVKEVYEYKGGGF